ncbi:MAG: hypothetical protein AB1830_14125 [Pseudomonadota bacterium]
MKEVIRMLAQFCKDASEAELMEKLEVVDLAIQAGEEEIRGYLIMAAAMIRDELRARAELSRLRNKARLGG